MILICQAHIDQAVKRNAVPGQAVIHRRLLVFRLVGGVIRGHRIRRPRRNSRVRFKLALSPFNIRDAPGQRLILFSKLLGLSLNVRQFVGMASRCDGENRRR